MDLTLCTVALWLGREEGLQSQQESAGRLGQRELAGTGWGLHPVQGGCRGKQRLLQSVQGNTGNGFLPLNAPSVYWRFLLETECEGVEKAQGFSPDRPSSGPSRGAPGAFLP